MKWYRLLVSAIIFSFLACANEDFLDVDGMTDCPIEEAAKTKDLANSLILGKWKLIKTTYHIRGSGTTIVTPESEDKTVHYEFTRDKYRIFTNGLLTAEADYSILFWGEGSNTVDDVLMLVYETGARSILFVDKSGNCLALVNSYNDAGGDLNFVKLRN